MNFKNKKHIVRGHAFWRVSQYYKIGTFKAQLNISGRVDTCEGTMKVSGFVNHSYKISIHGLKQ